MSDTSGKPYNEANRFGSAGWATAEDLYHAGLFKAGKGLQIGFMEGQPVYLDSPAPLCLIAGSGSGKLRVILSYIAAFAEGRNEIWNDPRGEIYACFAHNHEQNGDQVFAYNPFGVLPGIIPQHSINPLDILTPDSPTLQADATLIASALISVTSGENAFFGRSACGWVSVFLITLTLRDGEVTFKSLMVMINSIQGNPIEFAQTAEWMLECTYDEVRRAAGEILGYLNDGGKTFSSIMGEIYGQCAIFDNIHVQKSLEGSDFSLRDFTHVEGLHAHMVIADEFLAQMAPMLRVMFQVAMCYKGRAPKAPRLHMLIDEAAQLGRADFILKAHTYGRGAGIRALTVWQDVGQIEQTFGHGGLTTILGSSEAQIYFGVRDYRTAKYISDGLGYETLSYDDEPKQQEAYRQKMDAIQTALASGQNMLEATQAYAFHERQEDYRSTQARLLRSPDEILTMSENRMIVRVTGKNLNPIDMEKHPYYEWMDARYFRANPYYG